MVRRRHNVPGREWDASRGVWAGQRPRPGSAPLELGQRCEDAEHEAAARGRGVDLRPRRRPSTPPMSASGGASSRRIEIRMDRATAEALSCGCSSPASSRSSLASQDWSSTSPRRRSPGGPRFEVDAVDALKSRERPRRRRCCGPRRSQRLACLASAIDELPPAFREVVKLRDIEDRPNAEVAVPLHISKPNVAQRLHRAHRLLRRRLQAHRSRLRMRRWPAATSAGWWSCPSRGAPGPSGRARGGP